MTTATTAATVTMAAATVTMPVLTIFGVPLGLRPDLLIAGFSGALVAIVLLNSVPGKGDTWQEMLRTALRRMAVVLASSLTAGYLVPLALLAANLPESLLLSGAFAVGGGAQQVLAFLIQRLSGKRTEVGHG
ncbi:MAG: hypothetical protein ACOY95_03115 [Pseudomonadota bacterium]